MNCEKLSEYFRKFMQSVACLYSFRYRFELVMSFYAFFHKITFHPKLHNNQTNDWRNFQNVSELFGNLSSVKTATIRLAKLKLQSWEKISETNLTRLPYQKSISEAIIARTSFPLSLNRHNLSWQWTFTFRYLPQSIDDFGLDLIRRGKLNVTSNV